MPLLLTVKVVGKPPVSTRICPPQVPSGRAAFASSVPGGTVGGPSFAPLPVLPVVVVLTLLAGIFPLLLFDEPPQP